MGEPNLWHPGRDLVRLTDPWQAELDDGRSARLFIPETWAGKRIVMKPAKGQAWTGVATESGPTGEPAEEGWDLTAALMPGRWQGITVAGGSLAEATLEASDTLAIVKLEAGWASPTSLSVGVMLSHSLAGDRRSGLLSLYFTLTDERGEAVGVQEVLVGMKTTALAVEMQLARRAQGRCRLKAVLSLNGEVVDDGVIFVGA